MISGGWGAGPSLRSGLVLEGLRRCELGSGGLKIASQGGLTGYLHPIHLPDTLLGSILGLL